jgi:hypothetical protein
MATEGPTRLVRQRSVLSPNGRIAGGSASNWSIWTAVRLASASASCSLNGSRMACSSQPADVTMVAQIGLTTLRLGLSLTGRF